MAICDMTDLNKEELNLCWLHAWTPAMNENRKVDFEQFVKYFCMDVELLRFLRKIKF